MSYNDKEHEFYYKQNDNQIYNLLNNYFPVSDIQGYKRINAYVYTQTNKPMSNVISFIDPKIKTMEHSRIIIYQDLLCGGNIHIWVQDILERSVHFD